MNLYDVVVIGGGIAGASLAAELAPHRKVLLLEGEAASGYHATGRSAASIGRAYGNDVIRELTERSAPFFLGPPQNFAETPLVRRRPWLFIARADQQDALEDWFEQAPLLRRIPAAAVRAAVPILGPDYQGEGALDERAMDVDVHVLTQAYLRVLRGAGGAVRYGAAVSALRRERRGWKVDAGGEVVEAPVIVNAAGAWADEVAALAGLEALGVSPMRRTAILIDPPPGADVDGLPLVMDVEEAFYFKPEAGLIMVSPADETPTAPCDAQAEDYEVALAAHHFEVATGQPVRRVRHRWAGLRTFAADRAPVVGFDGRAEGFFWLAGQGGYGVQTAPALARLAVDLILGRRGSDPLTTALSPDRLAGRAL